MTNEMKNLITAATVLCESGGGDYAEKRLADALEALKAAKPRRFLVTNIYVTADGQSATGVAFASLPPAGLITEKVIKDLGDKLAKANGYRMCAVTGFQELEG